jgi:hypothetical protein
MTMAAMSALDIARQDLADEFGHAHLRAHLAQFGALFAGALASSVAAGGLHVAGWGALGALVLAAAAAAVRQTWPQIPWGTVVKVLEQSADAAAPQQRPVAPGSGGTGANPKAT